MGLKIQTEKTQIQMRPHDGFTIEFELESIDGDALDVSSEDYRIRAIVKTLQQLSQPDSDCLFQAMVDKTDVSNIVSLTFDATKTNFPVSKKPHYLILQISNPSIGFSREFNYELFVLVSGMRTIY